MLLSFLTVEKQNLPFKNVKTLLDNTNYKIVPLPGSALEDVFKLSTEPIYEKAWKERVEPYIKNYLGYN